MGGQSGDRIGCQHRERADVTPWFEFQMARALVRGDVFRDLDRRQACELLVTEPRLGRFDPCDGGRQHLACLSGRADLVAALAHETNVAAAHVQPRAHAIPLFW